MIPNMLRDKLPKERVALMCLAALAVAAGSYAVVKGQRRPAPIVFQGIAAEAALPSRLQIESAPTPKVIAPDLLVVHTTGSVKEHIVVHLPPGSRVDDAIKAAGGPTSDADLDAINLAAKLIDGTQVFVPKKGPTPAPPQVAEAYKGGEVIPEYSPRPAAAAPEHTGSSGRTKKEPPSQPISLNSAGLEELQRIPGIGPSTAQKILDYRKEHGRFNSVDELMGVKGIGQKKLDAMRKYLKL